LNEQQAFGRRERRAEGESAQAAKEGIAVFYLQNGVRGIVRIADMNELWHCNKKQGDLSRPFAQIRLKLSERFPKGLEG
jgi:hypothetical protein